MSFETDFDSAFTILLGKAQGTIAQTIPTPTPTTSPTVATPTNYDVMFIWGGGGQVLTSTTTDPILVELPDAGTVVWCHAFAGGSTGNPSSVTANVTINVTNYDSFGSSTSLGTVSFSAASKASPSVGSWQHIDDNTSLVARLTSFSGSATWLAVSLRVRRDA